uniref:3-hydroxyacyl-CoA dehydrogenase n=1 Tax=Syphacia muris TaxID=451379 RepID=A0A0N5ANG6_9BILA
MGRGITQIVAEAKYTVTLVDINETILQNAKKAIEKNLQRTIRKQYGHNKQERDSTLEATIQKISYNTDIGISVNDADLIIEAVPESLQLKRNILQQVEHSCRLGDAIIATNTSSLSLADISRDSKCPHQFAGLHFFNPVPVMKLVEVVCSKRTSDAVFQRLLQFSESLGKTAIRCKDTPGFIVNRLLVPYMFQAMQMLEDGDASVEDIDTAMKLGAGYPMGPFELADYIGLDTLKLIQDGWHQKHSNEPLFNPSAYLDNLVSKGKLGRKSGEGFYKYRSGK